MTAKVIPGFLTAVLFSLTASSAPPAKQDSTPKILPPTFITLGSFDENTRLHLECEGDGPSYRDLRCHLVWLTLRKVSDEEDRKARAELADIDKATDKDLSEIKRTYSPDFFTKMKDRMVRGTPEQRAALEDYAALGHDIAAAGNDRAAVKAASAKMLDMDKATCKISVSQGELTLTRSGTRRWISNPGPQGLCNVVTIAILESDPAHPALWMYKVTTVSADTEQPLCKGLKNDLNKPQTYSWDAPETFAPGCKYLEMGTF
jgi:hypothetical protein